MAAEQLAQAESFKEEGNRHHQEGNYKKALGAYHKVFCFINGLVPPPAHQDVVSVASNQIPQDKVEEVQRLKEATRLNMAACYLKLGEHQKCVDACNQALQLGQNAKAYFRRGQAYLELRNFGAAKADLLRAEAELGAAAADSADVDSEVAVAQSEAPVEAPAAAEAEVDPVDPLTVPDEAPKLPTTVRELTYAWQQTDTEIKVYISFDQSEELQNVKESQVKAAFGEWSATVLIELGGRPFGLRLNDFHRRLAPEKCSWALQSSRITLKLVKREAEHWWNLLQKSST
ncbi:N-terminally processed] [Durusdinium trenchii]|uniref:N-terminally processed] n=1 Tax=Durusdinium trenchii TaxID=1381693 RepID=A0ABP0JGA3_9DINO